MMQKRPLRWTALAIGLGLLAVGCGQSAAVPTTPTPSPSGPAQRWSRPPAITINPHLKYEATVTTSAGSFVISLFAAQDTVAVNNFVFLARHHFFDGDRFFRVLAAFVIQTGDPLNNGTGGPGYHWKGGPPTFPYEPGIVAMANAGNFSSNGSQFFICTGPESTTLNQHAIYTEIGRVTSGWNTITTIANGAVTTNPRTGETSLPLNPVHIIRVTIRTSP